MIIITRSLGQIDYAYELIDEIHPIEKFPIYDAYPWLRYITSRCCHGMAYFKPHDENEVDPTAVKDELDQELLERRTARSTQRCTYMVNGKEHKKRSKKIRINHYNEETITEPLARLGFGIIAYTGMLHYMIWAFALYSIMLIPVFMFYSNGSGYGGVDDVDKLSYASKTLGSLGFSSYQC